jgi:hypothetical protein
LPWRRRVRVSSMLRGIAAIHPSYFVTQLPDESMYL